MKNAGVKVTVIGIGSDVKDEELNAVASNAKNIVKVQSVDDLNEATPAISDNAGHAAGECITIICIN